MASVRQDLEERRLIDRAKTVLMQKHKLSEPEAYRRLRRMAMDKGQKLGSVAATVLSKN
ncbi:ANTAR domain-containing protein [Roseicella sp. GB24]|uniref:ANTAR domain-containing protein n=1 Tax=Roseicella aerolata TaxID=2883479 RepID=A0A9X1LCA1_9PROT|nr:ANTAR domain-containing protein [Roseicella aerolata]